MQPEHGPEPEIEHKPASEPVEPAEPAEPAEPD